jgi:ribosomal protein S7
MMHGRNNGKKLMAVRIVAHAFEIVRTFYAPPANRVEE